MTSREVIPRWASWWPARLRELLQARLDVVTGDPLPGLDGGQVDGVDHGPVVLDHPVGDGDPQVALGLEHGHPQPALEDDLVRGDHRSAIGSLA